MVFESIGIPNGVRLPRCFSEIYLIALVLATTTTSTPKLIVFSSACIVARMRLRNKLRVEARLPTLLLTTKAMRKYAFLLRNACITKKFVVNRCPLASTRLISADTRSLCCFGSIKLHCKLFSPFGSSSFNYHATCVCFHPRPKTMFFLISTFFWLKSSFRHIKITNHFKIITFSILMQ